MKPVVMQIGKLGVNESTVKQLDNLLKKHEYVKVKFLKSSRPVEKDETVEKLALSVDAEVLERVGFSGLLYRKKQN